MFGVVRLSLEIPPKRPEESVDANPIFDNLQKVNFRTGRLIKKALPNGRLVMNITSPEVGRVEEAQMS